MAKLIRDVNEKTHKYAYVNAPFDEATAQLEKLGYRMVSGRDMANLRISKGPNHSVSRNGNYILNGVLYVPQKGRFITKDSLVIQNATDATQAHREGKEFYVASEVAEKALASGNVAIPYNQSAIPTDNFGDNEIMNFVFGDTAQDYGEWLKEQGINELPLFFNDQKYVNAQEKPFANQLWLYRLGDGYRSGLLGCGRVLYYNYTVRGVKYVEPRSGEDCAKKTAGYQFTEKNAKTYLKVLMGVRNGTLPASKLEEVIKAFRA